MAQRRMFSLKIVDTDAFCEMPCSAQNLYFQIGMRADDEGFYAGVKGLMTKIHASEDDMRILLARRFIIDRGDGVYVVKHWKMNNYLQNDRITETDYEEKKEGLFIKKDGSYTLDPSKGIKPLGRKCIQNVYTDKNSIEESSIEIELDKTRYKQPALLLILLSSGYLLQDEIDDGWDSLLTEYSKQYGWKNTKIKLMYFLTHVCNLETNGKDKEGKPIFAHKYHREAKIGNRYIYFKTSMDNAFREMDDDDKPF